MKKVLDPFLAGNVFRRGAGGEAPGRFSCLNLLNMAIILPLTKYLSTGALDREAYAVLQCGVTMVSCRRLSSLFGGVVKEIANPAQSMFLKFRNDQILEPRFSESKFISVISAKVIPQDSRFYCPFF